MSRADNMQLQHRTHQILYKLVLRLLKSFFFLFNIVPLIDFKISLLSEKIFFSTKMNHLHFFLKHRKIGENIGPFDSFQQTEIYMLTL